VAKVNIGYPLFKQHSRQAEVRQANEDALSKKRGLFTEWLTQRRTADYFHL
jgi:hypothetical protein